MVIKDGVDRPAYDMRSLDTLKRDAKRGSPHALRAAAQQMEGIFIQMMMKSMRDATFKDLLMHSASSEMFTAMHDQQVAQRIAQSGQLGLAQRIVEQSSGDRYRATFSRASSPATIAPLRLPAPLAFAAPAEQADPFISRLMRPAHKVAQQTGLDLHLILAQAALESGWGQSEIRTADGAPSHNLFGIKASADWQGKTTEITTTEYLNGVKQKVKAVFRVYASYEQALGDYATLIAKNPRYQSVVQSGTPEEGAKALQASGYATDPAYAQKLINLIQKVRGDLKQRVAAYSSDLSKIF